MLSFGYDTGHEAASDLINRAFLLPCSRPSLFLLRNLHGGCHTINALQHHSNPVVSLFQGSIRCAACNVHALHKPIALARHACMGWHCLHGAYHTRASSVTKPTA